MGFEIRRAIIALILMLIFVFKKRRIPLLILLTVVFAGGFALAALFIRKRQNGMPIGCQPRYNRIQDGKVGYVLQDNQYLHGSFLNGLLGNSR